MVGEFIPLKQPKKTAKNTKKSKQETEKASSSRKSKDTKAKKKSQKCKQAPSKASMKKALKLACKSQSKQTPPAKELTVKLKKSVKKDTQKSIKLLPRKKDEPSSSKKATAAAAAAAALKSATKPLNNNLKPMSKKQTTYTSAPPTTKVKKAKVTQKCSPDVFLDFSVNSATSTDKISVEPIENQTSVWCPGKLYSDVLFGAGSSVKLNKITTEDGNSSPKESMPLFEDVNTTAEFDIQSESESSVALQMKTSEVFPSLKETIKPIITTNVENTPSKHEARKEKRNKVNVTLANTTRRKSLVKQKLKSTIIEDKTAPLVSIVQADVAKTQTQAEPDIVSNSRTALMIRETAPAYTSEFDFDYLYRNVRRLAKLRKENPSKKYAKPPLDIKLDRFNFTDIDCRPVAYPRFTGQFDDENYLRSEQMAMLGLKLALGNQTQDQKFKF